jgi:hypothetical protein
MSRYRIPLAMGLAVLLVVLFVVLRPSDDDSTESGTATARTVSTVVETRSTTTLDQTREFFLVMIVVRDGKPAGGIRRLEMSKGTDFTLIVRSDVADEVHLHGYDLKRDAAPGQPARFSFRADLVGRFEIELEDRGVQIAELTVEP